MSSKILIISVFLQLFTRFQSSSISDAISFIDGVIQPTNCTGLEYAVSRYGFGAGFASQFQAAASEWMRTFAATYSKPVIIVGKIVGYSDGKQCEHVNHEWTCYFREMSTCHKELNRTGKLITPPPLNFDDNRNIPPQFKHLGLAFWWGAVQHRLFRFLPVVDNYILEKSHGLNNNKGFPFSLPTVGMHVRHGDKSSDGWADHSLSDMMALAKKSEDCRVKNAAGDCFAVIDYNNPHTLSAIIKVSSHRQTVVLNISQIDQFSSLHKTYNKSDSKFMGVLHSHLHHHTHHAHNTHNITHNITHNTHSIHNNTLTANNNTIQHDNLILVTPLHIFVASDDAKVTHAANNLNYMTLPEGVSQQTDKKLGMQHSLMADPMQAFNATLEIIADMYFLSQCSTLLGISASQVFRSSVAMSNATGTLHQAYAMDAKEVKKIVEMSVFYHVPFPENFVV